MSNTKMQNENRAIGPNGEDLVSKTIIRNYEDPKQTMCLGCYLDGHTDACFAAPSCMGIFRKDKQDVLYVLPEAE